MFNETPHRRYNPLTDEWILVSPHRTKRPWQGQVEDLSGDDLPPYDPTCYLCPDNSRAGGTIQNPSYTNTFVFDNDFPALMPVSGQSGEENKSSKLFQASAERGICRVICFSPRHDQTLAHLPPRDIRPVVDVWAEQTQALMQNEWLHYVQIFENKGEIMGCSNPHPHGQLWATENIPVLVERENQTQQRYYGQHQHTMLTDILGEELARDERIIWQDEHWVILVPFWAYWPYETLLIPRRPVQYIHDLTDTERDSLAAALSAIAIRYDNLFQTRFPYGLGIHQAPVNSGNVDYWHLHLHFFPPLLRSATVKKFVASYELFASPQRDLTAEQAAATLRELPSIRFR